MKNTINIGEKYKINGHEYEIIKVTDTHVITYVEILSPKPFVTSYSISNFLKIAENTTSEMLEDLAETVEELAEKPKLLPNPTMIIRLFCKCAKCKKEREKWKQPKSN